MIDMKLQWQWQHKLNNANSSNSTLLFASIELNVHTWSNSLNIFKWTSPQEYIEIKSRQVFLKIETIYQLIIHRLYRLGSSWFITSVNIYWNIIFSWFTLIMYVKSVINLIRDICYGNSLKRPCVSVSRSIKCRFSGWCIHFSQ